MDEITIEEVFVAYYECRKHKRNTQSALEFELDYQSNLIQLWKDINTKKYKIGSSVTFCVTRPKLREIFAANFRDRIVHHILINALNPIFEKLFIEDSYSCRKNKGTLYGIERLHQKLQEFSNNYTKDCWIGKFDIKGFFMSIDKIILHKQIKDIIQQYYNKPNKDKILYLVRKVLIYEPQKDCIKHGNLKLWDELDPEKSLFTCEYNKGIPIGNLTSQIFANVYMNDFDHFMIGLFGNGYGRYVDDFYVITKTKEEILSKVNIIKEYLKSNLKLVLHPKKVYIQRYDKGIQFIGNVVKKNKIRTSNRTISNAINSINKINKSKITINNAISVRDTINSYLGFLSHHDTNKRKTKILNKLDKKWSKALQLKENLHKVCLRSNFNPYTIKLRNLLKIYKYGNRN